LFGSGIEARILLRNPVGSSEYHGHRGVEAPMSDKVVWWAVKAAARRAGITRKIGPHTFRHSFATELLVEYVIFEGFNLIDSACGHSPPVGRGLQNRHSTV
jgi:integrase